MTFKEKWESEETKVGLFFKYWIGYLFTSTGVIIEAGDFLLTQFTKYGLNAPGWLTHGLVFIGLLGYIKGKTTSKNAQ